MATKDNGYFDILVTAQLMNVGNADKVPEASAYTFSSEGRQLASAPLDAKGTATLRVPASPSVARVRVLVGPKMAEDSVDFNDLIRRGAQEQHLRIDPNTARLGAPFADTRANLKRGLVWLKAIRLAHRRR